MNNSNTADGQRLAFALKYSFSNETQFINGVLYLYQTCPRAKADMKGIVNELVAKGYTIASAPKQPKLEIEKVTAKEYNLATPEGYHLNLYIESVIIK